MKTFLFSAAFSLLVLSTKATETEKIIKSKPDKVTVYLQGAQVFRTSAISIPQGQSVIVFEGLENSIDPQSIQASGIGNCIITETQYLLHYPELQKLKGTGIAKYVKALKAMDDSLILLSYITEDIANQKEVLATEKSVLLNYGLYKGLSKKDSLAFLKDGLIFLREKLNNINSEFLRLKKEEAKIQLKIDAINERRSQIEIEESNKNSSANAENKPDYRVTVTVIADAPTNVTIGVNYFVPNAGWAPMYDLRTESVDKPIQLTYKATVFQNTGADWKEVKLTLSTADPKQNFTIPTLNSYFVEAYKSITTKKSTYDLNPAVVTGTFNTSTALGTSAYSWSLDNGTAVQQKDVVIGSNEAYEYVVMDENLIQAEFEIKLLYSIPSDNKKHYVSILNKELKTKYMHKTIPKIDLKAYLTARITDYEELNLLPGKANVYFGGTYIGKTYLQTGDTGDTLELSLGQDKNVAVKRNKVKDKFKEKTLDNDKYYDVAYEITVKNGNSKPIEIEVIDQVPLTQNQQIAVEDIDLNGAKHDLLSGEIKWRNIIKAKDHKKSAFSFTVKAPRNMQLVVK
ncbi:MAG: mucoidy inhibitor MuiA family protein [Bacteroidota bacterium]|nr:mucoidy inhibitor MuiA family protein [Bacteroidota bacterium]